jgi:hypothetical protein
MVLAILAQHYLFVKCFEYNDRYDVKIADVTHKNVQKKNIETQKVQAKFSYTYPTPRQ